MNITIDIASNIATVDSAVTIKAGSRVPVNVTFVNNGAPATLSGTPAIQLGLSAQSVPPRVLAYLDVFTAAAANIFTGTLDASDTRLVTYMDDKASAALNVEAAWTLGGELFIAPNFTINAQPQVIAGAESGEGGPVYVTTTALAAAIAGLAGCATAVTLPQAGTVTLGPGSAFLVYEAPLVAGAGSYTQTVALGAVNATAGAVLEVPIDFASGGAGTVNIYDGSASGTLLQTVNAAGGGSLHFLFTARFDGANWHKMNGVWVL